MKQYIDKSEIAAEIKRRITLLENNSDGIISMLASGMFVNEYKDLLSFLDTIEVKEVDLEKLGEIARHLIAVKEHIEDMRLDKDEWSMLEKIGYPENFKAQKGE